MKPQKPFSLFFQLYRQQFLNLSIRKGLIDPHHLAPAGDGTPVCTAALQRKKRICDCKEKGCSSCNCKRHYSQPDCNWGWDSHWECYFFGYHLYMYVASDPFSDLPVFPLLERASRHDMLSFLHSFFTMEAYLPEFRMEKLLLDSAHDAYPVYEYCRRENITPFIDLNPGRNTDAQKPTADAAASVNIPVHRQNTAEPYTFLPMIIQGCLTYRQGTLKHGKRNMTEELPWNAPTSARKRTIN